MNNEESLEIQVHVADLIRSKYPELRFNVIAAGEGILISNDLYPAPLDIPELEKYANEKGLGIVLSTFP